MKKAMMKPLHENVLVRIMTKEECEKYIEETYGDYDYSNNDYFHLVELILKPDDCEFKQGDVFAIRKNEYRASSFPIRMTHPKNKEITPFNPLFMRIEDLAINM